MTRHRITRNLSLALASLILGLLLSLERQPPAATTVGPTAGGPGRIQSSVQHLEAEQQALKAELARVRQELAEQQQQVAANSDRLRSLKAETDRQRLLAGLAPVQGPGVLITLDDSAVQIPPGADPNAYLVHEYDLRDIVNLLWMAGSEAVAINDERLVNSSSVYCVGSTVMVNSTRLSPPYVIRAIGNPRLQQDYLRNPSYLNALKEKQRLYGLRFEVVATANLTLPAYSGGFLIRYARPRE